jgi:hypothetical protein
MTSGYKINCKVIRLVERDFLVEYLFLSLYLFNTGLSLYGP